MTQHIDLIFYLFNAKIVIVVKYLIIWIITRTCGGMVDVENVVFYKELFDMLKCVPKLILIIFHFN